MDVRITNVYINVRITYAYSFENVCQYIQNYNGCWDKVCLHKCQDNISLASKTNVSIFRTAMDVRITIAYMNVKITYACF